jgi:hypothetical protein
MASIYLTLKMTNKKTLTSLQGLCYEIIYKGILIEKILCFNKYFDDIDFILIFYQSHISSLIFMGISYYLVYTFQPDI